MYRVADLAREHNRHRVIVITIEIKRGKKKKYEKREKKRTKQRERNERSTMSFAVAPLAPFFRAILAL